MSEVKKWNMDDFSNAIDVDNQTEIIEGSFIIDEDDLEHAIECVNALAGIENPVEYIKELKEKAWKYDELCK